MIHKESHTFLLDLVKDDYFGEIGFFTDQARTLSAKSRDYTDLYFLDKHEFLDIARDYLSAIVRLSWVYNDYV
jgi:CRP-like cAMP-binding protein